MPAAWVGPGCREKRVNFRRDRWLHGPDSESPTGKAGRHSRSTVAGLGEKRRLFFLYSETEWIITIEGRPSSKCVLALAPSFKTDDKEIEGDPAAPGYFSFAVCLLQGIPAAVAHGPGIRQTDLPPIHWRKDMRLSTESNKHWYQD